MNKQEVIKEKWIAEIGDKNFKDITMCDNSDCPFKEYCYRFKAKPSEHRQSYSHFEPFNLEPDDELGCDYFLQIPTR